MSTIQHERAIDVIKEGFALARGVRLKFLGAFFIFIVIAGIVGGITEAIFHAEAYSQAGEYVNYAVASVFQNLVTMPITLPLGAGLMMLALNYIRNESFEYTTLFNYYIYVWTLFFAAILTNALVMVGFMLLIIPGIYLAVCFMFVNLLIVDQHLGFIDAMKTSYMLVKRHWFFYFKFVLLASIINIAGAMALLIGLIFTLPATLIAFALLYEHALYEDQEIANNETRIH